MSDSEDAEISRPPGHCSPQLTVRVHTKYLERFFINVLEPADRVPVSDLNYIIYASVSGHEISVSLALALRVKTHLFSE